MTRRKLRPETGATVTLLMEIAGVPVTHVTKAQRVRDASMIVPCADVGLDHSVEPGATVTVIFVQAGQIYRWPMRIEEVLATSYFLTSSAEPGDGDRREFVRALLPMVVFIERKDVAERTEIRGLCDVSAAGVRLAGGLGLAVAETVGIELESEEGVKVDGRATVVRSDEEATALEFVLLSTANENRLIDLVFQARAASLHARIGVKL